MKTTLCLVLFVSCQSSFGQTNTNAVPVDDWSRLLVGPPSYRLNTKIIAVGDWSEPARDQDGHALRGRLLVCEPAGQSELGIWSHAGVYVDLQRVHDDATLPPKGFYFDPNDVHLQILDASDGRILPNRPVALIGPAPIPFWVISPGHSWVRLRADLYTLGSQTKPEGLSFLSRSGSWVIRPNATNEFFLGGTFTPRSKKPTPSGYRVWQGTMKFPKVKIPIPKP